MIYRLIPLTGPIKGQQITVETEPMVIGRDPSCTIRVEDEEVASKHAVVEHRQDGLVIRDLGSMNRILVNKHEVRESRLRHGDMIELGRTRFLVQALVQAEVSNPRPIRRSRKVRTAEYALLALLLLGLARMAVTRWGANGKDAPAEPAARASVLASVTSAAAPAATNRGKPSPMTDDIRLMREDLAKIRETMKELSDRPAPAATTAQPPAAARPEEPPAEEIRVDPVVAQKTLNLLIEARHQAAANNVTAAQQLLHSILVLDPYCLPAYEERAILFERQGQLDDAIAQWGEIIRRGPRSALYEKAVAERARVKELKHLQAVTVLRRVRIAGVDQHRLPDAEAFDERRELAVDVERETAGRQTPLSAIEVEIRFFDVDEATGEVIPTIADAPRSRLRPSGNWAASGPTRIQASYAIRKGQRARDPKHGRKTRYYGYAVSVFCNGELQDADARPLTLLHHRPGGRETAAGQPSSPAAAGTAH